MFIKPSYHRFLITLTAGLLLLFGATIPARADGLIFVKGVYRQPAVSHINVTIKNKIATTILEQTFRNTLNTQLSAVYVAPVPAGATITNFAELIDGQWVEASIKASEDAKKDFATAVSDGKDAALASGTTATPPPNVPNPPGVDPAMTFQTQINLPPNAERSVRLTYTEVLSGQIGLTRYVYPLSNSNLTDEKVGDLLVQVKIIENDEIRAVYSPSHGSSVEVSRPDATDADVVYRMQNVVPSQNFELVYTQSSDKFGLNLASYRAPLDPANATDTDGFFVLIAAPQLEAAKQEVVNKDFVFVLDRSGSMNGPKFTTAKLALKNILQALNPGDRFSIIAFDDKVKPYSMELKSLDDRENAKQWVTDLPIGGGTNINDALLTALKTVDAPSGRPHIIVFLTDGQATNGVTQTPAILENFHNAITPQSRIYTIGVGDVNKDLLESLAQSNRGSSLFVTDTQPLEAPLAKFYAAIGSPVLVDLALDFGGVEVSDLYPNPIPDMFLGGQVVITGRYKGGGPTTVTLKGNINGKPYTATYKDIKFLTDPTEAKPNAFVPRLWAQRKIDTLLRQININGPDAKLIEQVKTLGMQYNLITPYTSFVVTAPKKSLPDTGLPFLYVDEYRSTNTTLIAVGSLLALVGLIGLVFSRLRK